MITIIWGDGTRKDFADGEPPEYLLARACYADDLDIVKSILAEYQNIDLDATVIHSKTRGNGTPLGLTGDRSIAELLIARGADVNHPFSVSSNRFITPLDSAQRELTKQGVQSGDEYVRYLITLGAKTYDQLNS
jgi:hypothetical protein